MTQSVSAAARLIFRLRSADHITDALATLHWLCVSERRIEYKIPLLTVEFFTEVHHRIWDR